jgi:microcompartment protein CcmK/EutM
MTINTTTGALRLTKTEQKLLSNAKALLVKLAKHGDGALSDMADGAADEIGNVIADLNKVEEVKAA